MRKTKVLTELPKKSIVIFGSVESILFSGCWLIERASWLQQYLPRQLHDNLAKTSQIIIDERAI
jgi:hypothetical protein